MPAVAEAGGPEVDGRAGGQRQKLSGSRVREKDRQQVLQQPFGPVGPKVQAAREVRRLQQKREIRALRAVKRPRCGLRKSKTVSRSSSGPVRRS